MALNEYLSSHPNWTYSGGLTVQSMLNALNPTGAYTNEQVLAMPSPFDPSMTVAQHIDNMFGPGASQNLNLSVPDPQKGSLIPTGNDLGGMLLALAPIAAMVGGAALGGTGALSGAEALGGTALAEEAAMLGVGPELFGTQGLTAGALGGTQVAGLDDLVKLASDAGDEIVWDGSQFTPDFVDNFSVADSLKFTNWGDALRGLSAGQGIFSSDKGSYSGTDLSRLLGAAIPSLVGAYASNEQTGAITDLANKYVNMGAPYRDRLANLYADPSSFLSSPEVQIPVQHGTDALARSLSAKVGNPIQNMTALQDIQNYSANQLFGRLGQEKDRLAGFGGLSNYNAAAPGLESSAIRSDANFWNALGSGAANFFNPQTSNLESLLKNMGGSIFKVS